MKKRYVALLLGAAVASAFALPAFGSHTTRSLRALAERVDRVVRIQKLEKTARANQQTVTETQQVTAGADGVARASVNCDAGTEIAGGGAEFEGAPADSVIISSVHKAAPAGWRAAGKGTPGHTFTVFAVCVDF
jgi:hypothetical protein